MFLRPVLELQTVLPQESYLAVVIDNSESMKIKDDGQVARSDQLAKQFETTNFFKRLEEKFKVRTYRFDNTAERIERPDQLTFEGKRTKLEAATDLLQQELGTVPLSGVVLITDGADNASKQWTESLSKLESRKKPIPFYTVGVGSENITRDAEMVKVSAPRSTLKESTAVVEISYRSHGFSGRKANVYVRENGTLLENRTGHVACRRRDRGNDSRSAGEERRHAAVFLLACRRPTIEYRRTTISIAWSRSRTIIRRSFTSKASRVGNSSSCAARCRTTRTSGL